MRILTRDEFGERMVAHATRIINRRILQNNDLREDVLLDVIERIFSSLDKIYNDKEGSWKGWTATITMRCLADAFNQDATCPINLVSLHDFKDASGRVGGIDHDEAFRRVEYYESLHPYLDEESLTAVMDGDLHQNCKTSNQRNARARKLKRLAGNPTVRKTLLGD